MKGSVECIPIRGPFGWDALVALGTLSLAAVTLALVVATRTLASRADAEVRAQWRPVLLARDRLILERQEMRGVTRPIRRGGA